jgi:hypothetical protein
MGKLYATHLDKGTDRGTHKVLPSKVRYLNYSVGIRSWKLSLHQSFTLVFKWRPEHAFQSLNSRSLGTFCRME